MTWLAALCLSVPLAAALVYAVHRRSKDARLTYETIVSTAFDVRMALKQSATAFAEEIAAAMKYAARRNADATKYAARAMRPDLLRAKAPKSENPDPPEWAEWERAHPDFDENERLHLRWAFDVLRGVEKVSEEKRQVAMIVYGEGQVAYGLPQLDLRAAVLTHAPGSES